MSENTTDVNRIDGQPVVKTVVAEEAKPKVEAKAAEPAANPDAQIDYWANAWANRGV